MKPRGTTKTPVEEAVSPEFGSRLKTLIESDIGCNIAKLCKMFIVPVNWQYCVSFWKVFCGVSQLLTHTIIPLSPHGAPGNCRIFQHLPVTFATFCEGSDEVLVTIVLRIGARCLIWTVQIVS